MDENLVDLSMIRRLVLHRRKVLALLAVVGAALGAAASLVFSPGYESSSKVLLRGERDEKQMLGETQIATSLVVLDRVAAALDRGGSGADLKGNVTAAVVDGNVIQLRGTAPTPEQAQQLTERATTEYVTFSTQIVTDTAGATADVTQRSRDAVQQRIDEASRKVVDLQAAPGGGELAATELDQLRRTIAESNEELDDIAERSQAEQLSAALAEGGLGIIEPAVRPTSAASPTLAELMAVGATALVLLGIVAHVVALRTDRRLRRPSNIAAALGAPILGTIELDHIDSAEDAHRSAFARLIHDDRTWATPHARSPGDGAHRVLFCRRVLARLGRGEATRRLLVLVPEGDFTARRAAALFAATAGTEHEGAVVITDEPGLVEAVHRAAADLDDGHRLTTATTSDPVAGDSCSVLRLVSVSATRPAVPDVDDGSIAVVVLTAGTRTGWELTALTGACADAGQVVAGALVAVPIATRAARQPAPSSGPPDPAADAGVDDGVLAGSA